MKAQTLFLTAATIIVLHATLPAAAFAQSFNQGVYGSDAYGGNTSISTPTPTPTTTINTPIGDLPITGQTMLGFASLGATLVAVGLIIWVKKRRQHPTQA